MPTTQAYNAHIQSQPNGNRPVGSFRLYYRHILHMIIEYVVRGVGSVSRHGSGKSLPRRWSRTTARRSGSKSNALPAARHVDPFTTSSIDLQSRTVDAYWKAHLSN
jgi:hypothetical protein